MSWRALAVVALAASACGGPGTRRGPQMAGPTGGDDAATADAAVVVGPSEPATGVSPGRDAARAPVATEPADAGPVARPSAGDDAAADRAPAPVDAARDRSSPAADVAPASSTAGCAGNAHPLCLDFENGAIDPAWKAHGSATVGDAEAAHGRYALHLTDLRGGPMLSATQLGRIVNVVWARYYVLMSPGAPDGHGAMFDAYDQAGWYEQGWESGSFLGNWHVPAGTPERYMRSRTRVAPDHWVCVEVLFDGASGAGARIWADGAEVVFTDSATSPAIVPAKQFRSVEIGVRPYHGLSLTKRGTDDAPALTDVWIDDVAVDDRRIGCIADGR